jgi:Protein of unknown function (DUF2996)
MTFCDLGCMGKGVYGPEGAIHWRAVGSVDRIVLITAAAPTTLSFIMVEQCAPSAIGRKVMADENKSSNPTPETAATAPESSAAETAATPPAAAKKAKPAAVDPAADTAEPAAKKAKAPAVEDKPLPEFMAQDCLPALTQQLTEQGLQGLDLSFKQQPIAVRGYEQLPACWQIEGKWHAQQKAHQFNVYFFDGDLQGQRGFSASLGNQIPGTMESFRIDERKMSLSLFISGVLQRLNGQKWLDRN